MLCVAKHSMPQGAAQQALADTGGTMQQHAEQGPPLPLLRLLLQLELQVRPRISTRRVFLLLVIGLGGGTT